MAKPKPVVPRTLTDAALKQACDHMLADPDHHSVSDGVLWQVIDRARELLEQELRKRPKNRPRGDLGAEVAALVTAGKGKTSVTEARRITAKKRKKSVATVAQAHRRHLEPRQ